MPESIVPLGSSSSLPPEAGGKARGIREILGARLPSPPSWVVLAGADDSSVVALAERLRSLGIDLLAVRSSGREEDSGPASFAGIHESRLGISPEDLPGAVREVSSSTSSERALAYRESLGLPPSEGPCAALVQELVPAEVAGVAFSARGISDGVVIEAVEGLGETAVNGDAVPETHVLHPEGEGWKVVRTSPRTQAQVVLLDDGVLRRVPVRDQETLEPLLEERAAGEIAGGVRALAMRTGGPVDIEWAISGGRLSFLQCRPRTRPLKEELPVGEMWTRANVRDTYPDIPSALARSLLELTLDPGVRDHLRSCGTPVGPSVPLLATAFGRPVLNERIFLPGDLLGIPRSAFQVDFGGAAVADDGIPPANLGRMLRHPVVLLKSTTTALTGARRAKAWLEEVSDIEKWLTGIDIPSSTPTDLIDAIRDISSVVGRAMVRRAMALAGGVSNAQYRALLLLKDHPNPRTLLTRLLRGNRTTESTRQLDELVSLAHALAGDPAVEAFLASITLAHREADHWKRQLSAVTWGRVRGWLDRFGHRGPFESDISSPRYSEDLELFARTLLPLVEAIEHGETLTDPGERANEVAGAWKEIETRWGPRQVRRVKKRIDHLRKLLDLREQLRSETIRVTRPLRDMALDLGRRLAQAGRLREASDIWHLSLGQLERSVRDPHYSPADAVARERSRRAAWKRIDVPIRFGSEEQESFPSIGVSPGAGEDPTVLRGNGVSPGLAEGPALILDSPTQAHRMPLGSILVAPATDPGWTPLFTRAVAVVVELGGTLSHAGIVAREFGIPCVANIPGVTRRVRDGEILRVDGTTGAVTVIGAGDGRR